MDLDKYLLLWFWFYPVQWLIILISYKLQNWVCSFTFFLSDVYIHFHVLSLLSSRRSIGLFFQARKPSRFTTCSKNTLIPYQRLTYFRLNIVLHRAEGCKFQHLCYSHCGGTALPNHKISKDLNLIFKYLV